MEVKTLEAFIVSVTFCWWVNSVGFWRDFCRCFRRLYRGSPTPAALTTSPCSGASDLCTVPPYPVESNEFVSGPSLGPLKRQNCHAKVPVLGPARSDTDTFHRVGSLEFTRSWEIHSWEVCYFTIPEVSGEVVRDFWVITSMSNYS